mmetsp:Transcript_10042/g.16909  ORF Transcript_10042/g.16909 Transcript_10042/m.16909 type:complete len:96 (+) Transcript_10042:1184-1471(+)
MEGVRIFRDCGLKIEVALGKVTPVDPSKVEGEPSEAAGSTSLVMANFSTVVEQELGNIRELTDFEEGLRFAMHREADLILLRFLYLCNPYYLSSH